MKENKKQRFNIRVKKILVRDIVIEAESKEDALKNAEDIYNNYYNFKNMEVDKTKYELINKEEN